MFIKKQRTREQFWYAGFSMTQLKHDAKFSTESEKKVAEHSVALDVSATAQSYASSTSRE